MTKIPKLLTAVLAGACLLGAASLAAAGNHLKCYKVKDPVKLKGVVDLSLKGAAS